MGLARQTWPQEQNDFMLSPMMTSMPKPESCLEGIGKCLDSFQLTQERDSGKMSAGDPDLGMLFKKQYSHWESWTF
ncbi:unnamed protein product [Caretta caretta]